MSASRQQVEIRVYHDRRLGIGPWMEADPFVARRPEHVVVPELAIGYLLWYLTTTPPTRTAEHTRQQLIGAARSGRVDGLRLAGARGLVPVRVAVEPFLGAADAHEGQRELAGYERRRAASAIAKRLASEGVWTLGARAQELIDQAHAHGHDVHLEEVTDALSRIPQVRLRIADRAPTERARRRSPRWAWVSVAKGAGGRPPPWLSGDAALALIAAAHTQIAAIGASTGRFDRALAAAVATLAAAPVPVPAHVAITARARFDMVLGGPDDAPSA